MGKTSVMRMLESDLKENRGAATVWFNAWHYQREDLLLAYLLETIQKQAVPPWLSWLGLIFRLELVRVRLFADIDRLALTMVSIAFLTFWTFYGGLSGWHPVFMGFALVTAALPLLDMLIAFKSNPEKLAEKSGGFIVDTMKELVRLPSLVGKSDVRHEFESNLNDVVTALGGRRRLVIFLDDLDRCKPEQVVQILEAINFLNSAAACVIILGADYEKVETLVAMQFESIALSEAENNGATGRSAVDLRVEYARNYLRKVVNLRLNLRPPTSDDYAFMLRGEPETRQPPNPWPKRFGAVVLLLTPVFLTVGVTQWALHRVQAKVPQTLAGTASGSSPLASTPITSTAATPQSPSQEDQAKALRDRVKAVFSRENVLSAGVPAMILVILLAHWRSRPRRVEETLDADTFVDALAARSKEIFRRCQSPREVRRFLNYLRLIATQPSLGTGEQALSLRAKFPDKFDADLVDLASMGHMPTAES